MSEEVWDDGRLKMELSRLRLPTGHEKDALNLLRKVRNELQSQIDSLDIRCTVYEGLDRQRQAATNTNKLRLRDES